MTCSCRTVSQDATANAEPFGISSTDSLDALQDGSSISNTAVAAAAAAAADEQHNSSSSDAVNYSAIAAATEGFSGADIKLLCKEAAMKPVRR
jgi:SpoVK/Ycf46/Vps4 family AAA+-type ATPase